tara:strand:- start:52 stop:291 length:240 start_codon:yes stop_codon:yes gene_type:complete
MWGLFLLLVALGDEPAKEEAVKDESAKTLTDATPTQIADQLSDILSMLQSIPTDTKSEDVTAAVDEAKVETTIVVEKAK